MILAIDFDGTIVDHEYPYIGKIKKNAKEVINKLFDQGHSIIIWTCRYLSDDLMAMVLFLDDNNIKYHAVNQNIVNIGFCPKPKIYADIYIDDRSLFADKINWFDIERELLHKKILK